MNLVYVLGDFFGFVLMSVNIVLWISGWSMVGVGVVMIVVGVVFGVWVCSL